MAFFRKNIRKERICPQAVFLSIYESTIRMSLKTKLLMEENMKTTFKYGISAYSGTIDEITFGSYKNGTVCIARKYVKPRLTENNTLLGEIAKNLSEIYSQCSEEYKSDLRTYAYTYGKEKSPRQTLAPNGYSMFTKMMFTFAEANVASVSLDTITFSDIQSLYPEISSVASAVDSDYLPSVSGADLLTESM